MGNPKGFLTIARSKISEMKPKERIRNWSEYTERLSDKKLAEQGERCMDCGTPFCHMGIEIRGVASGCPIQNVIPEWNDLVYRGKWQEALNRLHLTNNFPEFTGRVCPAPCEGSCTLALNNDPVAIKSIERSIIDKGFENGWVVPRIPRHRTGLNVAIIGSGPAGLAAADELNQQGHSVTVYERDDRPGGLLMYGIPNMKLEKDVIERRVNLLRMEGIEFELGVNVGADITLEDLQRDYDAIILCIGAQKQRALHIEGSDANGVRLAMDYLHGVTKSLLDSNFEDGQFIDVKGDDVIVIGGGDTGADCVATAVRQGCKSVHQFGKHPELPKMRTEEDAWPKNPQLYTLDYAYEEVATTKGYDPREYCIQTKKIEKDRNGNVKALHTIQMEKLKGEDGFFYFKELPGTEKVWPAQHVFVAIGFEGVEKELPQSAGIEISNNRISASIKDFETNIPGVFAAGDARRGQSLVVWAIKEGRAVAASVQHYLQTISSKC